MTIQEYNNTMYVWTINADVHVYITKAKQSVYEQYIAFNTLRF